MKRVLGSVLALTLGVASFWCHPATAALDSIALHGELLQVNGRAYPTSPPDTKPGMLLGATFSFNSIVEFRPQVVMSQGNYRAMIFDAGLKITPDVFGFDQYLLGLFSPYAAIGAGVAIPISLGYYAKLGLSVNVIDLFSANVEIGYRGQGLGDNYSIENSPTLAVRLGMFL